jgi:hypothetical protein
MSNHNDWPVNGCDCLRNHFGVGIHVPQGGGVIAAACQRHGVHVEIREFVNEQAKMVGLVPGARDDEHRGKSHERSPGDLRIIPPLGIPAGRTRMMTSFSAACGYGTSANHSALNDPARSPGISPS